MTLILTYEAKPLVTGLASMIAVVQQFFERQSSGVVPPEKG
jgi:hypothetical protein